MGHKKHYRYSTHSRSCLSHPIVLLHLCVWQAYCPALDLQMVRGIRPIYILLSSVFVQPFQSPSLNFAEWSCPAPTAKASCVSRPTSADPSTLLSISLVVFHFNHPYPVQQSSHITPPYPAPTCAIVHFFLPIRFLHSRQHRFFSSAIFNHPPQSCSPQASAFPVRNNACMPVPSDISCAWFSWLAGVRDRPAGPVLSCRTSRTL